MSVAVGLWRLSLPPRSERRRVPLRTTGFISHRRGTGRLHGRHCHSQIRPNCSGSGRSLCWPGAPRRLAGGVRVLRRDCDRAAQRPGLCSRNDPGGSRDRQSSNGERLGPRRRSPSLTVRFRLPVRAPGRPGRGRQRGDCILRLEARAVDPVAHIGMRVAVFARDIDHPHHKCPTRAPRAPGDSERFTIESLPYDHHRDRRPDGAVAAS
jgi:hypothetical protein